MATQVCKWASTSKSRRIRPDSAVIGIACALSRDALRSPLLFGLDDDEPDFVGARMTATATVDEVVSEPKGLLESWLGRNASFGRSLAFITFVGALWRLGFLIFAKMDQQLALNDSMYYSIQASLNSEGSWFQDGLTGQPGAEHGMLTSLYLTPWSIGPSDGVFRQRFALTLLGIATVAIIGLTGRRLAGALARPGPTADGRGTAERIGLVAAGIAAVYPNLWIHDSVVMSESIAILLVSLALFVALGHHSNPSVQSGFLLGVVAALGALTRSELVLLIPGFAALSAILSRRRRLPLWPALAIVIAGVATLMPWSLYNASRFNEPVFLSTNDGTTLLGANCDSTYYDDIGGWDLFCLAPLPSLGVGHNPGDPDASDRSADRRERAMEYVEDHLDRLPLVMVARVYRLLDLYGLPSMIDLDVGEEKTEWAVWAGIVCWWLLAVLAVIGWRVLSHRRVSRRWWLAVPWCVVLATAILIYGAHRIRAPGEPTVVLLAAVAIVTWWERTRAARSNPRARTSTRTGSREFLKQTDC